MKNFIYLILFLPIYSYSETITLKDGARIEGEFEGIMEDTYMVRTKYGVLNIKKSDIISPENIEIKNEENINQNISTSTLNSDIIENKYTFKTIIDSDTIKKFYYENDILIATQTFNLKNELINTEGLIKDGKYIEYFTDGKIKTEKNFSNGKENGITKIYYPDGILQSKAEYLNGLLNGSLLIYSPSAKLLFEQNYKNGLLDGLIKEYNEDGTIKRQMIYSMGKEIIPETSKKEINQQEKKVEIIASPITAKKIKIARGSKYIIYFEKKYKATLIIDSNYNILDQTGKLPDGILRLNNEDNSIEEWTFEKDNIKSLKIFDTNNSIKESFTYQGEKAIKEKI